MSLREGRYAEARQLSQMLVAIAEQAKADFAAAVEPLGLSVPVARAVLMLDTPVPMGKLADKLARDRPYITNLADKLEERGLVERVPGDDRRVKLLALTKDGVALRGQISDAVAERSMVLRLLTAAQRKTLAPILEQLLN